MSHRIKRGFHPHQLLLGLTVCFLVGAVASAESPPELKPFEPYLDKTWKAVVNDETGAVDVARWEWALAGQAVRIVHSVNDGAYGGVTFVMWDRAGEELVFTYFTTAGFFTRGTMHFDDDGKLTSTEQVVGNQGGVTEVRATQEVLEDGRLRVVTRMLRNDTWEDRGTQFYVEAPSAQVILPSKAN